MDIVKNKNKIADIYTEIPFDFSLRSSIGVGGKARLAYYPHTETACETLLNVLWAEGVPFMVVGNLTNVLPTDADTEKIVICTKKMANAQIGKQSFAEAGVMSGQLLRACRYAGKSGVEFLNGIPCTLGGALYMNAGVSGAYISDVVESVKVWKDGHTETLSVGECAYAYKSSIFMREGGVILGATLALTDADAVSISQTEKAYEQRRAHLPKGRSMGCVFKNPNGVSAGELIERAGLKGMQIGGAYVSETHANFIINGGNATSADICALIACIQKEVESKFNIKLQEEIRYLT